MTIGKDIYLNEIGQNISSWFMRGQLKVGYTYNNEYPDAKYTNNKDINNKNIAAKGRNESGNKAVFRTTNHPLSNVIKERFDSAGYKKNALDELLPSIQSIKGNRSDEGETIRLSFQLMTRAEPAEMVIETINSLIAVKETDDEILIIDNNHTDVALYQPLAQFCAALDPMLNVHFYHIDAVVGFKAGALNLALGLMNPMCTHVVVVDSDYQALPHARASIAAAIETYPRHSLLQFPQFYRDAGRVEVHGELNHYFNYHLYRDFNRQRALSTGTYAVIQRTALIGLGGWSGASITEDAQMGVLMHRQGLQSQFIPRVIATGLLPNTVGDLMSQRCRWIYGNMQVLNTYFSNPLLPSSNPAKPRSLGQRLGYMRAHLSQLSAWVNMTGIFILLHVFMLLLISGALLANVDMNLSLLLMPLYAVYTSYALFLGRRLWVYCHDAAPLNQQINGADKPYFYQKIRVWLMHLNFWELGALSWLPVLWGREKPFICTPKKVYVRTRRTVWISNIAALPKLIFITNLITLLIVAPFSPLYSPLLFACAMMVCLLKLWSAQMMLSNYGYAEPNEEASTMTAVFDTKATIHNTKATIHNKGVQYKSAQHGHTMSTCADIRCQLSTSLKEKQIINS